MPEIEDKNGWHGLALPPTSPSRPIAALGGPSSHRRLLAAARARDSGRHAEPAARVALPHYALGEKVATRRAWGDGLVALAARAEVVVLDAEVGNSTMLGTVLHGRP